jgi:predicted  nucleic acid-binding Zn-ribbon protein
VAESIVTLRVDTRNAVSSLNNASAATNKLSVASKGATKSLAATSTAARGLGTALKNSIAPILAVGTAFSVVNNSIGTFLARERDIKILEQGITNLGAGAHTLRELQEVADRFGKTTLFNQEDFTRGFNLLTSFRNIGVDAYERVAQSAADIAQVNQVDVSTSFMQLAKALQDPERNLSNLNRSGIAFTKQQTEVIKQLMKTNKVAEAHTMILDIVDESYNKLAQAAAVGFAGSVDTLGESFRDFGESIGKALIPVLDPAVKGLTAILNFLNSEGGQATAILAGIALAAKGISVAVPLAVAGLSKFVISAQAAAVSSALASTGLNGMAAASFLAAGGITKATIAVHAFKLAMIKTGIGALVVGLGFLAAAILKAKNEQKEFNELLESGTAANISKEVKNTEAEIKKLEEALANITKGGHEGRGDKLRIGREIEEANQQLDKLKSSLEAAEARELTAEFNIQLDTLKKQNAELIKSVQRDQIKGEEKKKEFDLEQQIAAIKKEFDGEEEERLVSLAKQNHELKKQKTEIEKINEAAKRQDEIFKKIGDSIATGVSDALVDAILHTKSLAQSASALLNDIARQLLRLGINTALSTLGGPFAALPTFAAGGKPPVGRPSIVGEKGPELFVPSTAGTIIPNHSLGGGGITNNIVVNVDASGSNVEGNEQQSRELGLVLSTAIQAQLIQEKRPGGLLA